MKRAVFTLVLYCAALPAVAAETDAISSARNLLAVQRDAWNRADIDAFMQGYWQSQDIRFASGDAFKYGWQVTLDGYTKAYPSAAAMGKLDFDLIEVRQLSTDAVYVFGKWNLTRANEAKEKDPQGLFTLIVERKNGAWVITRDHTSVAEK